MIPDPTAVVNPGRLGDVFKEGMEDVLGRADMEAVFKRAGLLAVSAATLKAGDLGRLVQAMQELFGPRAGLGISLCTGRACFKYGLKSFGTELGLHGAQFHLKSPATRIKNGLELLAQVIHPVSGRPVRIEQDDRHYHWIMEPGAWPAEAQHTSSFCHLVVGVLQEFLYWAGGGKYYPVEQKACILNGAPSCYLTIDKHSLD